MNSWAQQQGQPGLGYIFWREGEEGGAGPVAKNIGPERTEAIRQQFGLKVGDAVFFTAGDPKAFYKFAGEARNRVGTELGLTQPDQFACCWIVDFPFYEWNEDEKRVDFAHNPFSMPQGGLEALNSGADPLSLKAFQYDMVCNGYEIASGSIRNASPETMVRAFEITGLSKADVEAQFGGMYRAFQFGAPPPWWHGRWRRSHRHACLRRAEPARDHAVPDEPAGAGSSHGRAQRSGHEAVARAWTEGRLGQEVTPTGRDRHEATGRPVDLFWLWPHVHGGPPDVDSDPAFSMDKLPDWDMALSWRAS